MSAPRGPLRIAVSGPDGAGRSRLARRLLPLLRERGFTVVTAHGHDCLLCRRLPVPPRVRDTGEPGGDGWARRATDPERRGSPLRRAHAFLDAAEPAVRLAVAGLVARRRARGGPAVVLTDGGPLDGLARRDPPTGSGAARLLLAAAADYDLTLLVESGPDPLRGRGPDTPDAPRSAARARYRCWSRRLPGIARLDGTRPPSLVAAAALERVLVAGRERDESVVRARREAAARTRERAAARARAESPAGPRGTRRGPDGGRRHVVVSVYEDVENPGHRGGGALVAGKVARRLADDFRVTVVTAGLRGGAVERDGIRYVRLPVRRAGPRAGRLLFLALLPLVSRRIRHDLWLESFTPPLSASFLPLTTAAPVVGIDHGRGAGPPGRFRLVPFAVLERLGLRCYRHIVVMNAADGRVVRRLSPRADVQVFADGVEQRAVDETRLGSGQFILYLGRIDTWGKGLDLLLDAYDRSRPPLDLLLAGTGAPAEERRLAALVAARTRGPEPRIHWVGYADEDRRRQLLRDSAFLVMPSRHEAFGRVALEAMAHGKPVLHFDLPALRWMRDGGDVAVAPFDVAALGERMTELSGDAALRRRLGRRSALAAQHYTWDETTGRYLALAHRLLDAPSYPRRPTKRGASWRTTL
ncbi:glycosyltransferase family 4 protein [Streptomyces sp. NPDC048330]|uniref:glycosyltransferase family 4 protein n=1 Tax=Streptomyces sp. NPDC048330 TaxID=3365533 RepID=UPI003710248E